MMYGVCYIMNDPLVVFNVLFFSGAFVGGAREDAKLALTWHVIYSFDGKVKYKYILHCHTYDFNKSNHTP